MCDSISWNHSDLPTWGSKTSTYWIIWVKYWNIAAGTDGSDKHLWQSTYLISHHWNILLLKRHLIYIKVLEPPFNYQELHHSSSRNNSEVEFVIKLKVTAVVWNGSCPPNAMSCNAFLCPLSLEPHRPAVITTLLGHNEGGWHHSYFNVGMRPHPNTYKRPLLVIRVRLAWAYPISAPATSCLPHKLRLKMKKKKSFQIMNICKVQVCLL